MPDAPPYRTAFDNGVDRLYHYQKFNPEHLENTLVRDLVRFARPSSFNDPWDCKPVFSIPQDKNERERRVQELITNQQELRRLMDKLAPEMHKQMDERYRVYCLTRRPASPLMWAHYADHHRGICLEINVRQPDLCAAIQVQYRETYPSFRLDADRDLSPFYTKSSDWQYEDEYRLIAEEEDRAFSDRTLKTRNQFYKLPSGSLISIIIGVHAPDETRRTIRSIVDRSGKNLSIRQAARAPDRYEILIDPPI